MLPIRSYYGTFAWVTCPLVLKRLARDGNAAGSPFGFLSSIPVPAQETDIHVYAPQCNLVSNQIVYLEDLDLKAVPTGADPIANGLANILFPTDFANFKQRFGIVSDAIFIYLCETATEITARVALNIETKTVRSGGLWYEEAVPAETVFCGPILIDPRYDKEAQALLAELPADSLIQIGGKSSVGRGLCRVVVN